MSNQNIKHGVTAAWKKSSYSAAHGDCVEVSAPGVRAVAVRDSKDPHGPSLTFSPESWAAFLSGVDAGTFNLD